MTTTLVLVSNKFLLPSCIKQVILKCTETTKQKLYWITCPPSRWALCHMKMWNGLYKSWAASDKLCCRKLQVLVWPDCISGSVGNWVNWPGWSGVVQWLSYCLHPGTGQPSNANTGGVIGLEASKTGSRTSGSAQLAPPEKWIII